MSTVEQLRKNGYKVRVSHYRWLDMGSYQGINGAALMSRREAEADNITWNPDVKGGETIVEVTSPEGLTVRAIAECSEKDTFNRKMGLRIALGRALISLKGEKELVNV